MSCSSPPPSRPKSNASTAAEESVMNALRKEQTSSTEQVARDLEERRQNFSRPEVVADPADRRPPQSVAPAGQEERVAEIALPDRTASTASAQDAPALPREEALPASPQRASAATHTPLF